MKNHPRKVEVKTLLANLLAIAKDHPKRIALRSGNDAVTYEEFRAKILSTAACLRASGVAGGDRVLICAGNTPIVPILYFAVHALGAIAAPVASDTPDSTLATLVADAEAKLAIIEKAVKGMPCAVISPTELLGDTRSREEFEPVCDANKVADLLYTSGTTGRKKGVVLTHANIMAAAHNITEFVGNGPEDIEVVPLPLSHSFGLGRLRSLAITGHSLVLEQGVGRTCAGAGGIRHYPANDRGSARPSAGSPSLHRDRQCFDETGDAPVAYGYVAAYAHMPSLWVNGGLTHGFH